MIKIVAIDKEHANAVNARKDFKSVVAGRAVIIDMCISDVRTVGLMVDSMGYTDDVSEWDVKLLRGEL